MHNTNELPWWLYLDGMKVWGSEGEDDQEDDSDGENDDDSSDEEEEEADKEKSGSGDQDKDESEDDKNSSKDDAEDGLKSALRKERRRAKQLERENKRLKREKESKDGEEEKDLEQTKEQLTTSNSRVGRLAEKLLTRELNTAIADAARDAKFIDVDDALGQINRDDLDYEQDEDDPSEIDIEMDSVVEAVKALGRKKPHLIQKPNEGRPSGGRMGGSGGSKDKRDQKTKDDQLKEEYPSLR